MSTSQDATGFQNYTRKQSATSAQSTDPVQPRLLVEASLQIMKAR